MNEDARDDDLVYVRRHLAFGWWSLLCFVAVGVTLEALHGFKVGWYLDEGVKARRLLWTLGHAHGGLLSLVHVAFSATIYVLSERTRRWRHLSSPCLISASLLLPGGFFIGGMRIHGGDPGIGILLVPVGALALFAAVLMTARDITKRAD